MAGSDHSGEDIEAGRVNRAENRTILWAQRPAEKGEEFEGAAILIVEAAPQIEDDDFKLVDDDRDAHGVLASGIGAGAGVVGFHRRNPIIAPGEELSPADLAHAGKAGVFGKGATGVVAQGDLGGATLTDPTIADGVGVGIIGRGDKDVFNAPGVVGFSGAVTDETVDTNTGVIGKGETGVGGLGTGGPGVRGVGSKGQPGVLGIGGIARDTKQGSGVVGLGRGKNLTAPFDPPPDTGVFGGGLDGVKGVGTEGRGGIFQSELSAQVQLVPLPARVSPDRTQLGPSLPTNGRAGDLMSVVDRVGECTLWLCVKGEDAGRAARWAQVLLGPPFDGRA
jgi:hypothetical protein